MYSGRSQTERVGFRAFGFLPHLQLSSTWAFPGPPGCIVQIADTQIPFKILLISTTVVFDHCTHLAACAPWPLIVLYISRALLTCGLKVL